jgi:hypothetical protein
MLRSNTASTTDALFGLDYKKADAERRHADLANPGSLLSSLFGPW